MEKYNNFKKKFGQNFLTDKNLLNAIVVDAKVDKNCEVLEIGAGEGALTQVLANYAKKVISYEIDNDLENILQQKFENAKNVKIIFADALKTDIAQIERDFNDKYMIVANIPYYITTPLIFKFLENSQRVDSLTLMVQKEVAERICAKANTVDYGALSVICQYYCDCKILRVVSKKMFRPVPKVDSAVIKLTVKRGFDNSFSNLVRNAFAMRRKTLQNNLVKAYSLSSLQVQQILSDLKIAPNVRAENLSCDDFALICKQIASFDNKN